MEQEPTEQPALKVKAAAALELQKPHSVSELFWSFSALALHGFGGVLPWAQRILVEEKRWLSREEFLEILAFAQVLPGPNVINLSLIFGDRYFGWRGALAAISGMLLFPGMVVGLLAMIYDQFAHFPLVRAALQGMSVAASALVLATGAKLAMTYRGAWHWLLPGALSFIAIGLLRRPMLESLAWLLPLSFTVAWLRLKSETKLNC